MQAGQIQSGVSNSLRALHKRDGARLASASGKVTQKYKGWRLNRKKTAKEEKKRAKVHYDSGAFDCQGVKIGSKRMKK